MTKKKRYFKGKNDGMFKAVFCNPKNIKLLEAFIEDGLRKDIKILKIYPPQIVKGNIFDKGKTLDVLVKAGDEIINIEINTNYYKTLHRRNASYIFSKYIEDPKVGEDYSKMRNYIQMNITSGLPKNSPIKSEYVVADLNTKEKYIDNLTIYEYNLDKIKGSYSKNGEYKFIAALDCNKEELKKICKGNEIMEKFEDEVNRLNDDVEFTEYLTAEEDARILRNTLISEAKEDGKQEGIEIGITTEKYQIAKNLLKKHMDINEIAEITNLTQKEIESLK